jgi:hypothetical protein
VSGHLDYSNATIQNDMERLLQTVEAHRFYARGNYTDSWLRKFLMFVDLANKYTNIDISNETLFNTNLKEVQ